MIEYPSIINSSKAPRKSCIAFDKIDGTNLRFKYSPEKGFHLAGTRTQLIDESTPFWGHGVSLFNANIKRDLENFFRKDKNFRNFREIVCFGEFFGEDSFAGVHGEAEKKIIIFDILCGHKDRKFVLPQDFIKIFNFIPTPNVIYRGNLNQEFIDYVRKSETLNEGVICKGTERSGAFRGGVWMCKIKTQKYFDRLKEKYQENWKNYAE